MTFDHKREKYAFIAAMVMIIVFVALAGYGLILAFKPY
jgi:hypothetical protein